MPLTQLIERTPGLDADDFEPRGFGELSTGDRDWDRLIISDGGRSVFDERDVGAWVIAHAGRVSVVCTRRRLGGPVSELPRTIGAIQARFLQSGLVLDRATPGDFLSTGGELLVRKQYYLRDDLFAGLIVDLDSDASRFYYDLCVGSVATCRSPEQLRFEEEHRDAYEPLVRVRPPTSVPPSPPR